MSTDVNNKLIGDYNDALDITLVLMLIIPLIIVFLLIISYLNNTRAYQVSVSQHKDFPEESNLGKLSKKLGDLDQDCKNSVRWLYSHKYLDPIYGLCEINTVEDCYRWLVCKRPDLCPKPMVDPDGNSDCSKLICSYDHVKNV